MAVKTITFCDICSKETNQARQIHVKWCNEKNYETIDICEYCQHTSNKFLKDHEQVRPSNHRFKAFLRLLLSKKAEQEG